MVLGGELNRSFGLFPGQSIDEALGFWAKSVRVDNPGGQWVVVPGAQLNVAPYTSGAVASLIAATQEGQASATPIVGQGNTGSGQGAVVTFYDDVQPSSSGTIQTPSLGPSGQVVVSGSVGLSGQFAFESAQTSPALSAGNYDLSLLTFGIKGKSADLLPYDATLLYSPTSIIIYPNMEIGTPNVGLQQVLFSDPLRLTLDGSSLLALQVVTDAVSDVWGATAVLAWSAVIRMVTT